MGIHVHVKGQPDNCGCCALKEKLDTLWNRAGGSVTVINGVYPDADGHITVDLLQEAAVQSIIEDYIEPMQDNLDAMNTRLDGYSHVFDDYAAIVQAVSVTLPGEIDDVQDYAEAIADDLLQNYLTKQIIQSTYATKAEIQSLATRQDIQNVIDGYVFKNGTATPQVISGTGGLQIIGDLAVGGDITASDNTTLHFDNVGLMEIAGMDIRKDGSITRLSNTNGLSINGLYMSDMVSTIKTAVQSMRGPLEVPTLSAGAGSLAVVNKQYVSATDGTTNNLVHTDGAEKVDGRKNNSFSFNNFIEIDTFSTSRAGWHCLYDLGDVTRWIGELVLARISNSNFAYRTSKSSFEICIEASNSAFVKKNFVHGTNPSVKLCHDSNGWHILVNCPVYIRTFTRLDTEIYSWNPLDSTPKLSPNAYIVVNEPTPADYDIIVNISEW